MTPLEIDEPDNALRPVPAPGRADDSADHRNAHPISRRTAIGAGVLTGAGLLAACGSDTAPTTTTSTSAPSSASSTARATNTTTATPAPTTSSPAATSTAAPEATETPTTAEPSVAAPPVNAIAKVADIPSGGSLVIGEDADAIALFRAADGSVVAHTAVCTHMQCIVTAEGPQLHCFCHQSLFDAATGAVVRDPAPAPLAPIAVAVQGDSVVRS